MCPAPTRDECNSWCLREFARMAPAVSSLLRRECLYPPISNDTVHRCCAPGEAAVALLLLF